MPRKPASRTESQTAIKTGKQARKAKRTPAMNPQHPQPVRVDVTQCDTCGGKSWTTIKTHALRTETPTGFQFECRRYLRCIGCGRNGVRSTQTVFVPKPGKV